MEREGERRRKDEPMTHFVRALLKSSAPIVIEKEHEAKDPFSVFLIMKNTTRILFLK